MPPGPEGKTGRQPGSKVKPAVPAWRLQRAPPASGFSGKTNMKSRFRRAATAAIASAALTALSGQAMAHGHYYHGGYYGNSGWWIGGAALLGAGVALALSSGPRYGYSGVTYVSPPVYYPPVQYAAPVYARSEEHTSELQSLMRISYAVFCL